MVFNVLQKQLDASTLCPYCQAAMFWVEAEQYDQEFNYHECSHCQHQIHQNAKNNCYCEKCLSQRKKQLKDTRVQESRQRAKKTRSSPI